MSGATKAGVTAMGMAEELTIRLYHNRVDRLFLPLGIRQNRIEDIFADFLASLVVYARGGSAPVGGPKGQNGNKDRFGVLRSDLERGVGNASLPSESSKRDLVVRWLQAELVREERSSNRNRPGGANRSIVPLHVAVAERFGRPDGNNPAYGDFICEMLCAGRPAGEESSLMERLWEIFNASEGDPLAAILALALAPQADGRAATRWGHPEPSFVRCVEHARRFQRDIENVLHYQGVSRRTRLVWLYALFTFHLATYFLRMALAARRCAEGLSAVLVGEHVAYSPCARCGMRPVRPGGSPVGGDVAPCSNAARIVLGERNRDHARLMRFYPYYTSQLPIARSYVEQWQDEPARGMDDADALVSLFGRLETEVAVRPGDVAGWFEILAEAYPTRSGDGGDQGGGQGSGRKGRAKAWRLSEADKKRALDTMRGREASAFETVARYLNFDDMTRASNGIMEWQFYQALARDPIYGFARGRGDELQYGLSEGLLSALVHSYVVDADDAGREATVRNFEEWIEGSGLSADESYRKQLLASLVDSGLMEDVSDAGDAKRISPLYEWERKKKR